MSWETTDVVSADTTDVLSADTTDVLSADTTDVLSADTSKFWECHNLLLPDLAPQKWKSVTIWTYREISQRKSQEWHSLSQADPALVAPALGDSNRP